jgi:methyl-accepting chemotaxis protein
MAEMKNLNDTLKSLLSDNNSLVMTAVNGKLDVRADASKHKGDFRNIVTGINQTLDAVIGPLNMAANYLDR